VSSETHPANFQLDGKFPDGILKSWQILTGNSIDDDGWAVLHGECTEGEVQPTEADLHLAAAAPDLLKVVERFARYCEQNRVPEFQGIATDAFAAIAKAENGEP
jgi:hypothetical protein